MEKLQVRRIGVLVKPNQPEALQTICRLVEWCAGRGINVAGAVVHNSQVRSAVHGFESRRASQKVSAPATAAIRAGIRPGMPSQIPGTSIIA